MSEGFATGWMQGQEFNASQAMAKLGLAEGRQRMEKTQLEIDQTKRILEAQRSVMAHIAQGNQQTANDPQSQARALATRAFDAAEIYDRMGLPEQGAAEAKKGGELLRNAAAVDRAAALKEKQNATYAANLMNWVKSAPNEQEAQRRWQSTHMMFQENTGMPSQYANQPYDPRTVDMIIAKTQTKLQETEGKLKEAETRSADASTREKTMTTQLRAAQIEDTKSRTEARGKAGAIVPERYVKEITAEAVGKYDIDTTQDPRAAAKLRTLATEAAEHAQDLVKRNGLPLSQARKIAFDEMDKRGAFDEFRSSAKVPGATHDSAIPVTAGSKPGKAGFYKNAAGQVSYWDGKQFSAPPPPKGGPLSEEAKESDEEAEEREADHALGIDDESSED